jgi:hypothetical protein
VINEANGITNVKTSGRDDDDAGVGFFFRSPLEGLKLLLRLLPLSVRKLLEDENLRPFLFLLPGEGEPVIEFLCSDVGDGRGLG